MKCFFSGKQRRWGSSAKTKKRKCLQLAWTSISPVTAWIVSPGRSCPVMSRNMTTVTFREVICKLSLPKIHLHLQKLFFYTSTIFKSKYITLLTFYNPLILWHTGKFPVSIIMKTFCHKEEMNHTLNKNSLFPCCCLWTCCFTKEEKVKGMGLASSFCGVILIAPCLYCMGRVLNIQSKLLVKNTGTMATVSGGITSREAKSAVTWWKMEKCHRGHVGSADFWRLQRLLIWWETRVDGNVSVNAGRRYLLKLPPLQSLRGRTGIKSNFCKFGGEILTQSLWFLCRPLSLQESTSRELRPAYQNTE